MLLDAFSLCRAGKVTAMSTGGASPALNTGWAWAGPLRTTRDPRCAHGETSPDARYPGSPGETSPDARYPGAPGETIPDAATLGLPGSLEVCSPGYSGRHPHFYSHRNVEIHF